MRDCIAWHTSSGLVTCWLVRKPCEGTMTENVLRHGCGSLNIDGCRIATFGDDAERHRRAWDVATVNNFKGGRLIGGTAGGTTNKWTAPDNGRFPANVIFDSEQSALLDEQSGLRPGCKSPSKAKCQSKFRPDQGCYQPQGPIYGDTGGASRFFHRAETIEQVKQYLVRLIVPPNGTLLDMTATGIDT